MEPLGSHFRIERAVLVPVDKLVPNPWNIQQTDEIQQRAIAGSLGFFGQVEELLVRHHPLLPGFYQILSGEHRARELSGDVYANIIHGLSDAEAKHLSIVMNSTHGEAAQNDLMQLLGEIELEVGLNQVASTMPIPENELLALIEQSRSAEQQPKGKRRRDSSSEKWVTLKLKIPIGAMATIQRARLKVEEVRGEPLPEDDEIAWGLVVEALAAELLSGY
mgnify:CR=1 FL=1|jgi:hypothetical protein